MISEALSDYNLEMVIGPRDSLLNDLSGWWRYLMDSRGYGITLLRENNRLHAG